MRLLLILFFCFSLYSCADDIPKDIMPQKKMQAVLWDMMNTGEFLNTYVLYKDTATNKNAESQKWYNKVYKMHAITKADFDKSYDYYTSHPALIKEILDSLAKKPQPVIKPVKLSAADSLRKRNDSITAAKNSTPYRLDSLRKSKKPKKLRVD